MSRLQLQLLGGFSATIDGELDDSFPTDKVRALLAYLSLESDRPVRRSQLATLLWAEWDEPSAHANLRKSLFRLRQTLNNAAPGVADEVLESARQAIQLRSDAVEVDALRFQSLLDLSDAHQHDALYHCPLCRERLIQASELYQGDLLAGLQLSGAMPFEEWLTVWQERLHRRALALFDGLTTAYQDDQAYATAIVYASSQLRLEPWRESAHRQLMALFAADGQQARAIQQYETCRRILEEELGILPTAETDLLLARIKQDRGELQIDAPAATMSLIGFPAQVTTFLGRDENVAALLERLSDPGVRLVTLTGFGGSGKTALAVRAASRLAAESAQFQDGGWFIPLQAATGHDLLVATIGSHLGVTFSPEAPPEQQIIESLASKRLLLVLDNYEQLLPETRFVEQILQEAPSVKVVVTSRIPLDLRAEWRLPVDGLSFPTGNDATPDNLGTYEAAKLLESIARQVTPAFAISADNAAAIARICERLDGMPLALEIAGNWLRVHTPDELADQIDRSLDFLVATHRDTPDRHRSLQVVFNHSWSLLSSAEQAALTRLTCFEAPFSLAAIRAITGTTIQELTTLIDHALVRRHASGRYSLHPVLREYARVELATSKALFDEHARWHLQRVGGLSERLSTHEAAGAISQLDEELDDIRRGWAWAVDRRHVDWLAVALDGLSTYYESKGFYGEGRDTFRQAASHLGEGPCDENTETLIHRLQLAAATFLHNLGHVEEAVASADEICRKASEPTRTAARLFLGRAHNLQGNYDEAVVNLEEAMTQLEARGDDAGLARGLHQIGLLHRLRNDYERSIPAYEQSLSLYRQLDNELGMSENHAGLGLVYKDKGEFHTAIHHLKQAKTIAQTMNHRENTARFSQNLGLVYWQMEDLEQALVQYEQALRVAEELQHRRGIAICLGSIGVLHRRRHQYEEALGYYQRALVISEQNGDQADCALQLGNIGNVHLDMGQFERAIEYHQRALAIDRRLGALEGVGRHLGNIGDGLKDQERYAEARLYFEEGIPLVRQIGSRYYLSWQLVSLAEVLFHLGDLEAAAEMATEAESIALEIDRRPYHFLARLLLARLTIATGDKSEALEALAGLRLRYELPEEQAELAFREWELTGDEPSRHLAVRLYSELATEQGVFRSEYGKFHFRKRLSQLGETPPVEAGKLT